VPRVLRISKERRTEPVSDAIQAWLMDEHDVEDFEVFLLDGDSARLRHLVEPLLPEIVDLFVASNPGRRPRIWWRLRGDLRARLGGTGATSWERYRAIIPRYDLGVPAAWEDIDDADPPMFESQATFLKRHELFLPGEAKRLRRPDFAPEPCVTRQKKEREKHETRQPA